MVKHDFHFAAQDTGGCVNLSEVCIRRPVFACVLSLIIVVLGINGYLSTPLRFFPKITVPTMQVDTYYQGADPQTMETSVTIPLENAISSVPGIQSVYSTSGNAWSWITINFRLGSPFQDLVSQVRNKVYAARKYMPNNADLPIISTGGSGDSLLNIGIEDKHMPTDAIRDYVSRNVLPQLTNIKGVGSASLGGGSNYAMRIWLDSQKMAQLGITVSEVKTALESNNIQFPAGTILDPQRSFSVVSRTKLHNKTQFANIVVAKKGASLIRFKDFARVVVGTTSFDNAPMRINGTPGVILNIRSLKGANPLSVARLVKARMQHIAKTLPKGMRLQIVYDQSIYLNAGLNETFKAIFEAIILVVIVVFIFLGNVRSVCVPVVTIPLCIIGVFAFMNVLGFSINVMTLLAIVLAIGLVVDDAIVMLENIHRHIEAGLSPIQAAIKGSREMTSAVIAMTITLAAVYAPVGLSQGFTAAIFRQFAFTLTVAVLISGFIALTLSPMMCAKLITPDMDDTAFSQWLDKRFESLSATYRYVLIQALQHRVKIYLIVLGIVVIGVGIFLSLSREFIPQEDIGIFSINMTSPSGANIHYTEKYMQEIAALTKKIPEIADYLTWIYSGSANSFVILKPWYERETSTQDVIQQLLPKLQRIPGVKTSITMKSPITFGKGGSDFTLYLMTTDHYKTLLKPIDKVVTALKHYPGLTDVDHGLKYNSQQFALTINRDLAGQLGVSIQSIADTVQVMLGGMHITDFLSGSRSYDVIVQMRKKDLENFNGINKLYVQGAASATTTTKATPSSVPISNMVPLSSLVTLKPIVGQENLQHFDHMRATWISAQLAPGYSIGDAVKYAQSVLPKLLPPNVQYAFTGKAWQYTQASGNMLRIILLALIFIYLILAAQFESFIDPFIILFTVPLSIVGALFFLKISGGTLSVYSEIGLVTLIGLISKHGILITQFVNQLQAQGMSQIDALVQGATTRLRPIIMTTSAMVLGSVPLLFATGPGALGRKQIGWVIVGGLLLGTFFSLFIVPIAYATFSRRKASASSHH